MILQTPNTKNNSENLANVYIYPFWWCFVPKATNTHTNTQTQITVTHKHASFRTSQQTKRFNKNNSLKPPKKAIVIHVLRFMVCFSFGLAAIVFRETGVVLTQICRLQTHIKLFFFSPRALQFINWHKRFPSLFYLSFLVLGGSLVLSTTPRGRLSVLH